MARDDLSVLASGPVTITEWFHAPWEKFSGSNSSHMYYEIGLSKPELDSTFHFLVRSNLIYNNEVNGEVFRGRTEIDFHVAYRHDAPTVEFLFSLIEQATFYFAQIFSERVRKTNLHHHKIPKAVLKDLFDTIRNAIDQWDAPARRYRARGGTRLEKFKNLPTIPTHKRYDANHSSTLEQRLTHQLISSRRVTIDEEKILIELKDFYNNLNLGLRTLDYGSFKKKDFLDFANYIHYAFNFQFLISERISFPDGLFRLVVNESIQGTKAPIEDEKFLTYPPSSILKKSEKYNRASTWNLSVLYLAETLDTALRELRPENGALVTVGIWASKPEADLNVYPILYDPSKVNSGEIDKGWNVNVQAGIFANELMAAYADNYFNLLARVFSKPVKNHHEYLLSALLSENILELDDPNPAFSYDGIIYLSVGNNYHTRNIAVRPSSANEKLTLISVIEFTVINGQYDRVPVSTRNPASVSVAEITGYRQTNNIADTGKITW